MSFNVLFVLILVGGWLAGKLLGKIGLPSVLGMTLWGIGLSLFFGTQFPEIIWDLAPSLKSLALIIILLRAGLGIKKETLKKVGITAILMAFIPCLMEGFALMVLFHFFVGFSWTVAGLTGFLLAAVSPAVVVPSMLDLKERGFGQKNEVPTVVLAGASLDDVFAITLFSMFLGLAGGGEVNPLMSLLSIPFSIILGILPGIALGFFLVWYFKRFHEKVRATEKLLLLLGLSVVLLQVGDLAHTAALLGIMTTGFILLEKFEPAANELSLKLNKAWVFAEIILFVLIGMSVDPAIAVGAGLKGIVIISGGLVFRSIGVLIATSCSKLSWKERLFCLIAYIPKATVQAAMGSVPLAAGVPGGELILAFAVLSIVFTAPLGLLGIRIFGPKLLEVDFPGESLPAEGLL